MPDTYILTKDGPVIEHTARITKFADRQLQDAKVIAQVEAILAGVNTPQRTSRGWTLTNANGKPKRDFNYDSAHSGQYAYHATFAITCKTAKVRPSFEAEFQTILNSLASKANMPAPGIRGGWKITEVDGKSYVAAPESVAPEIADNVGYAPVAIPDDWLTHFNHLYGVDSHISRIHSALEAATLSDWRNRFHCVLIGPPGCGKSDICQSIKRALGEDSVLEFDATSTTMAGAQKDISERDELPRVLIVEEIEKAPDVALAWLLSVLDLRAEIRKTTFRGDVLKSTKMLGIATVNDEPTFQAKNFGALQSRFANKIYFKRPVRDMLERILHREVERVQGDERWIAPTLDYASEHDITDARTLIAVCLCGRERLLDGSYQQDLLNTSGSGWQ